MCLDVRSGHNDLFNVVLLCKTQQSIRQLEQFVVTDCLFLFLVLMLDLRLALWVAMGVPISFLGAFLVFETFGVNLNMMSLFALIVVLGVVVVGALRHHQVLKLMNGAEGLICPSRSEGLPMVLLEAGALSRPVVCSRIGPFMVVSRDGESSLMVPPEDPDALANAVIRLARDPMLGNRLGWALQARVRQDFSAEHMVSQYLHIYHRLVDST